MSGFIKWLEEISAKDTKVRAVLRRSLSFGPGEYPAAFPYVEPFVKGEGSNWRREAHYLIAGLWAMHWREGRGAGMSIGKACAHYQLNTNSTSTERRFITLLDSDVEQLPNRLRQVVALLKEHDLDFEGLSSEVCGWNSEDKWVQNKWARDFYRSLDKEMEPKTKNEEVSL